MSVVKKVANAANGGGVKHAIDKVRDILRYDKDTKKIVRRYNKLPENTSELTEQLLKSKVFKNKDEADKAVKNLYSGEGTGSFFGDIAIGGLSKVAPKSAAKVKDAIAGYQRKLYDIDMKAGKRLADFAGSPKRLTALIRSESAKSPEELGKAMDDYAKAADASRKSIFVTNTKFAPDVNDIKDVKQRLNRGADTAAVAYVPRATAPISKAMKAVLPVAGALAVSTKIDEAVEKRRQSEEGVNDMDKRELAERIASGLGDISFEKQAGRRDDEFMGKIASATLTAAEMMKKASAEIKASRESLDKIAGENRALKLQVMAMERSGRAVDLATSMKNKGLLKQADFESKIDEIMDLNDDAYKLLKEAVDMSPEAFSEDSTLQESLDFIAQSGESMPKKAEDASTDKMSFSEAVVDAASRTNASWSFLK